MNDAFNIHPEQYNEARPAVGDWPGGSPGGWPFNPGFGLSGQC
jgi:hypothetical protein